MDIKTAIEYLDMQITDPASGLPDDLFYFASRIVPMVNVDLLIKNNISHTLLSWRDDPYAGKGWHIPGGIIRFKEKLETRIEKVAEKEIGTTVQYKPEPIKITQVICDHNNRGHFISLLYECYVPPGFEPENKNLTIKMPGFLKWFENCPENLIKVHEMYRKFI